MDTNKVEMLLGFINLLLQNGGTQEITLGRQKGKTTMLKNLVKILASDSNEPVKILLLAEHAALLDNFTDLVEMFKGNANIELILDVASTYINKIATDVPTPNLDKNFYVFVDGYNSIIARLIANSYAIANNAFNSENKDAALASFPPKVLTFKKPYNQVM